MKLQTKISLKRQPHHLIDYESKLLLLGSCFSDNIGHKFDYFKFNTLINPFGILFHPLAIENLITRAINQEYYTEKELRQNDGIWYCFEVHSKLRDQSEGKLVNRLNLQLKTTEKYLKSCSHVVLTFGTSWVYRHIATDAIVANCHKFPQKEFIKELLSLEQIEESLDAIISLIRDVNPKATFILTVSPVRHLKDGFVENNRSKAHLISAVHNVISPRKGLFYFPSYELMMDELRDYRFYGTDMIHPNPLAVQIIWERFRDSWIVEKTMDDMETVDSIQKRLSHNPFNPNSDSYKTFLSKLNADIQQFRAVLPSVEFERAKHPQI
jgi:lysophospholipase L1-like esterase